MTKYLLQLVIISLSITSIAITLSIWGIIKSIQYTKNTYVSKYFQLNAIFSNLFNCGACISVSIYFIWLILDPLDNNDFFLKHESIRLRISTTASWYTSKIFLFLIFNGRLFFLLRTSTKYHSNHTLFKCLNIFVVSHAVISLVIGYISVMEIRNEVVANIGFNTFHVSLAILLFYLSIQFNRRIFYLSTSRMEDDISQTHANHGEANDIETKATETSVSDSNKEYLRIVTRSSILLTIIIPCMLAVSIMWTLHRFLFDITHRSMCIALLIMALDSLIDIICVSLLFKYADCYYNALCKCK